MQRTEIPVRDGKDITVPAFATVGVIAPSRFMPPAWAIMDLTAQNDSINHPDRQAGVAETEDEITPEMIQAGARVLYGFETLTADETYWAVEVYRAMRRAARSAGKL
jgi:hypothetical protein